MTMRVTPSEERRWCLRCINGWGDFISPVCASNAAGAPHAGKERNAEEVIC
jgi:hypothetical protein